MTRINYGIHPEDLPDKLLLAEHREIKRIPNEVTKMVREKGISATTLLSEAPDDFKLGKGHVKFFRVRLLYLLCRYLKLHSECKRRGFDVTDFSEAWHRVPAELYLDSKPSQRDADLVIERIKSKGFEINPKKNVF